MLAAARDEILSRDQKGFITAAAHICFHFLPTQHAIVRRPSPATPIAGFRDAIY